MLQITDAIYAWGYVSRLGELLGRMIERDPSVMLILHMFFLKFKRWMDVPLSRIAQNQRFPFIFQFPELLWFSFSFNLNGFLFGPVPLWHVFQFLDISCG